MKFNPIYFNAAQLIEDGAERFACHAVQVAAHDAVTPQYCAEESEFTALMHPREYGDCGDAFFTLNGSENDGVFTGTYTAAGKHIRVIGLLFCALALSACARAADPVTVDAVVSGFSVHSKPGFNGVNPGVGVRVAHGDYAVQAGEYLNSYRATTAYVIGEWAPLHVGTHAAIGAFAGVATGYSAAQDPARPLVAGMLARATAGRYGVAVRFVPSFNAAYASVVTFEATVRVW